ncbi:MAG: DNA repair exonuclease [Clostridia bacterium]|nr:DNA repair exonuclease [Clostridia bacterium]
MKIIHTADLHLGSALTAFGADKAAERRRELVGTFSRLADYAHESGAAAVLICGDLFDTAYPSPALVKEVLGIIARYADIFYLILCGNHDKNAKDVLSLENLPDNAILFDETLKRIRICGVSFWGTSAAELNFNASPDPDEYNIVMAHGTLKGANENYDIDLRQLVGKNIDYLALGHYHTHNEGNIDNRGIWSYCGCLESRGFDECGTKGFVELDTEEGSLNFVPFSERNAHYLTVDVSGLDAAGAYEKIVKNMSQVRTKDFVKVVLTGEAELSAKQLEENLKSKCYYIVVEDKTGAADIAGNDLVEEFLSQLMSVCGDEKKRRTAARCGVEALTE